MATVLHYVESWLPVSAGFVHTHVRLSRHRGVVVSRQRTQHRAAFPHEPVWRLAAVPVSTPVRLQRAAVTLALMGVAVRERADLVHVHFGHRARDVLSLCRRRALPLVLSLHGHDATAFPRAHPGHYDGVLTSADAVVVPSQFLAERAVALGAREQAVVVAPAGVDMDGIAPTPLPETAAPTVLFVGRLVDKKGVDVLLAAWPSVLDGVPRARLRVVGDGPLAGVVHGTGVELVAPDAERPRQQVRAAMRAATVVVSPSRTAPDGDAESMLLVNLEAQASGRPVVTTRHGGIPEFVDEGRTALLVPEGDAPALAGALVRALTEPGLAARLGAAGPAWTARFTAAASTARVDELYDTLAGRPGRGRP